MKSQFFQIQIIYPTNFFILWFCLISFLLNYLIDYTRWYLSMTNEQIIQYIKDNYETRNDDIYFWSTFILPDGSFIIPENDDDEYVDDMYEHANIIGGVADNCFGGSWFDAEQWLEQNCVKGNVNYPYLHFPKNPTNKQYWAAEDYMDYLRGDTMGLSFDIFHAYDEEDISKMGTPIYISIYGKGGKAYDLDLYKSSEIIDRVKKARVSGVLEESNNNQQQLTKNKISDIIVREFRDSRVRDNNGELIPCSLCEGEQLFKDEYGIYFKPGNDYYLDIRNPIFIDIQGIRDIITYLRQYRKYDVEIDRYKQMKRVQYDYQLNEIDFIKYLGYDGIITYDKQMFVVTRSNQVIHKDYDRPKTYKTIVGDVVLEEDKQVNNKDIKIDNSTLLLKYDGNTGDDQEDYYIIDTSRDQEYTLGYVSILPKEQYLKAIEVYESGKGIGTKILTHLINNDIIDSLDVDKLNYGAQRLYLRLGFKPYQLIWGSVGGNGNDRYVMVHSNKLNNYYVYYQGDSYTTTYADDDCILIANMKNNKIYFDVSKEDTIWEDLNDLNIYYEDVEDMLVSMSKGEL